jgi:hypothetical protein
MNFGEEWPEPNTAIAFGQHLKGKHLITSKKDWQRLPDILATFGNLM